MSYDLEPLESEEFNTSANMYLQRSSIGYIREYFNLTV